MTFILKPLDFFYLFIYFAFTCKVSLHAVINGSTTCSVTWEGSEIPEVLLCYQQAKKQNKKGPKQCIL